MEEEEDDLVPEIRRQWAVYWSRGALDENALPTYSEPVELLVRWEDVVEIFLDRDGNEQRSRAKVFVGRDLQELGVLWNSNLSDDEPEGSAIAALTNETDPFLNNKAFEIRKLSKIPSIEGDKFVRMVYL
jgi:hypothetical protein